MKLVVMLMWFFVAKFVLDGEFSESKALQFGKKSVFSRDSLFQSYIKGNGLMFED